MIDEFLTVGPYTVLPDNSILITANMQSETGFPSSHQLKSYVASKSFLKLAARAVLSADAGLLVMFVNNKLLWSPYGIGQTVIFSCCGLFFFLLFFFPRLISAAADWMSAILPHMVWP